MLVRCPDCTTKYEIAATLIPEDGVKVRCPKCKAVFPVTKVAGENGSARTPDPPPIAGNITPKVNSGLQAKVSIETPGDSAVAAPAPPLAPSRRPKKKITDPKVATRLARAVVQEVLYGRAQERREALQEQRALSTFGVALADAFDVYRERVMDELPGSTAAFREAVNDILGEGKRVI